MTKTRVLCVDDVPEIAALICDEIDRQPDMTCVESMNDATNILDRLRSHRADVLVLDFAMSGPDSLDVISAVSAHAGFCRVIAYSGFDDQRISDAVYGAGGWGFVSKHEPHQALIDAIRSVMNDRTVFPSRGAVRED
jgi:DNA-binding NarL/FixJ family response regulator